MENGFLYFYKLCSCRAAEKLLMTVVLVNPLLMCCNHFQNYFTVKFLAILLHVYHTSERPFHLFIRVGPDDLQRPLQPLRFYDSVILTPENCFLFYRGYFFFPFFSVFLCLKSNLNPSLRSKCIVDKCARKSLSDSSVHCSLNFLTTWKSWQHLRCKMKIAELIKRTIIIVVAEHY